MNQAVMMMIDNQPRKDLLGVSSERAYHRQTLLDISDAVRARRAHLLQVITAISESHVQALLACISC